MDPDAAATLARPDADRERILEALEEARTRTWLLADGITDEDLGRAATDYLSPPAWDLGHMANFEELWLVQTLRRCGELRPGYNDTYDAMAHPRAERPRLRLLDRDGVRRYMDEVRARAREVLDALPPPPGDGGRDDRLLRDGFVYWMLVLHEHQHQETLLQTIRLLGPRYRVPAVRPLPAATRVAGDAGDAGDAWLRVPAGTFRMGAPHRAGVYDNEAPEHDVHVAAFDVARHPVTCGAYLRFVEAGGYDEERLWSDRGRRWLAETEHHAPLNWTRRDGAWHRDCPLGAQPVDHVADEVLCHVTFFEAEAYANWRGARLPTEAEWEKAARWDPATGETVGRNPWGDAPADPSRSNVDQLAWTPSRVGSHPAGRAPCGAEHMVGDVWEWTSSGFEAYPGFEPFPYREYSDAFFGGDYRVLRGGSWATRAGCATATFRNWDHPHRRQVFAGIRLARDA